LIVLPAIVRLVVGAGVGAVDAESYAEMFSAAHASFPAPEAMTS
jgi:hypothetical protein